jgi:hypothetical protein
VHTVYVETRLFTPHSTTMSQEVAFYLPDILRNWPCPRSISAFYDEVKKESSKWCESFKVFRPKVQDVFNFSRLNLLVVLLPTQRSILRLVCCVDISPARQRLGNLQLNIPKVKRAVSVNGCRIGCDLMKLFFVINGHRRRERNNRTLPNGLCHGRPMGPQQAASG